MKPFLSKQVSQALIILGLFIHSLLAYAEEDIEKQITNSDIFKGQVTWIGQPPKAAESEALWNAVNAATNAGGLMEFERFIRNQPESSWTPPLRHYLAKIYRQQGRYSSALNHWEAAWREVKDVSNDKDRALADAVLGNWAELLSVLGRSEELKVLFAETSQRDFIDRSAFAMFQTAKEAARMMEKYPSIAFRCGTFALAEVGKKLQSANRNVDNLIDVSSPSTGFTFTDLVKLSDEYKLDLLPVNRGKSQELIVPSVIHWRGNHYAAIIDQIEDHYLVSDPTFGRQKWLSASDINHEASGVFLVPAQKKPEHWAMLSKVETDNVVGKGYFSGVKDGDDEGCKKNPTTPGQDCPPCDKKGMPRWWVSEPYLNLWIGDEPLGYRTSLGEEIAFKLSYKQRDTRPATLGGGPVRVPATTWNHNWFSYVYIHNPITQYPFFTPSSFSFYEATVFLPGGGERFFPVNVRDHEQSRTRLEPMQGNTAVFLGGPDNGFYGLRLINADGSQYLYGLVLAPYLDGSQRAHTEALLTQHIDRFGNTNSFYYEGVSTKVRLKYMVDYNGKTNTLRYTAGHLLYEVENPYGQKAEFAYDSNGNLTNIIDAIGLPTSLSYDSNNWPTNMVTPYGTNTFTYTENSTGGSDTNNFGGHDTINRAIKVTEPNGGNQLFLYRFDSEGGLVTNSYQYPSGTPLDTLDDERGSSLYREMSFRNSFHWNQKQYTLLSTEVLDDLTFDDYQKGHQKHWLADSNNLRVTGLISMEREPSDGTEEGQYTWYDYYGKNTNATYREGTGSMVAVVARILPNGETEYTWTRHNKDAYPTNVVSTFSLLSGVGTRTNVYVYDPNITTYVIYERDGSGYKHTNHFTNFNLLRYVTNWNNQLAASYAGFAEYSSSRVVTNSGSVMTNTLSGKRVLPGFFTNGLNEVTRYTYGPFEAISSVQTPAGLLTTNFFSNAGFLMTNLTVVSAANPESNRTNTFSYSDGLIQTWTNELGLARTYSWDDLRRITNIAFPDSSNIEISYRNLEIAGIKDREGHWRHFGYNPLGQLTFFTNELNKVTSYGYCGCGSLENITNALNEITTFFYDNQLRLTAVAYPDNSVVTYNHDRLGRLTNVIDTTGASLTNWFNHQGLLVASSNAIGRVRGFVYDVLDRRIQLTGANDVTITNTYDLLNRLLTRTYPDQGIEKFVYSTHGLVAYTNQLATNFFLFYNDAALRPTNVINPNLELLQVTYNPAGRITTLLDGRTNLTTWKFDEYGRLTNKLDDLSASVLVLKRDKNGSVTNRWTPAKANTVYSYDAARNLTNVDYEVSADIQVQYDALNRVTNLVKVGLFTNKFGYTSFGSVAFEDGPWHSDTIIYSYTDQMLSGVSMQQPSSSPWNQSYLYDDADRLEVINSPVGAFSYGYDPLRKANVRTVSLPNGSYITNAYDVVARLTGTWLKNSSHGVLNHHGYVINQASQRTSQARTDGSFVDYTYDRAGQLKTAIGFEQNGIDPRHHEQFGYAYDEAGNLSNRTNNALIQTFSTDTLNQLTTAGRSGTLTVAGTTTSPATGVTVNGTNAILYADNTFAGTNHPITTTYTAVAQDSLGRQSSKTITVNLPGTVNFSYDLNGNLLGDGNRTFVYDDENQLIEASVSTKWKSEFAYDGLMRRALRKEYGWNGSAWVKTNEVRYIYDGRLVLQERDANNTPVVTYTRGMDLSESYQGAGGIGGLLARTDHSSAKTAFYHADGNGNVTAMVNQQQAVAARYLYDPFGNTLAAAGPLAQVNAMRFSSKEIHAPSGTYYYGYRFYDPNLQRWVNRDPIGERGGINLYRFVRNDSINRADPLGLWGVQFGSVNIGIGNPNLAFNSDSLMEISEASGAVFDGVTGTDFFADNGAYDPNDPMLGLSRDLGRLAAAAYGAAKGLQALAAYGEQLERQEPCPKTPKPPGWNENWEYGPSSERTDDDRGNSWYDEQGGEWSRHDDATHDPHWDYNPHRNWVNDEWRNVNDDGQHGFGFENYNQPY